MSESTAIAEFSYRVRWTTPLFGLALFGGCGAFMAYKAVTNERGLVLFRVIELGPTGATVFFWSMAVLGFAFAILSVAIILQGICWPMRIVFTDEGIIAPRTQLSRTEILIPYKEILGIRVYRAHSHDHIELHRPQGSYVINGMRLPSAATVRQVTDLLTKKCPHLKQI